MSNKVLGDMNVFFDGAGTQTGACDAEEISFITAITANEAEHLPASSSIDLQDNRKLAVTAMVTERNNEDGIAFYYKAKLPGKGGPVVYLLPSALTEKDTPLFRSCPMPPRSHTAPARKGQG